MCVILKEFEVFKTWMNQKVIKILTCKLKKNRKNHKTFNFIHKKIVSIKKKMFNFL